MSEDDRTVARIVVASRLSWIKQLGRGSFGDVWLASREERHVAVKILKETLPDNVRRFTREARILWEQRGNRFVVDMLAHQLDASPPYFVMEYCEGGSLRKYVQQRLPWRSAVAFLSHAAHGVEGIHAQGGFHRDIKPDNLLLAKQPDGTFIVKVADFGIARMPSTSTVMTGSAMGTPGYIAPEILAGRAYHAPADVFSLGVVALELLTGGRDVGSLDGLAVPGKLKALVQLMLASDPQSRPTMRDAAGGFFAVRSISEKPAIDWGKVGAVVAEIVKGLADAKKLVDDFERKARR